MVRVEDAPRLGDVDRVRRPGPSTAARRATRGRCAPSSTRRPLRACARGASAPCAPASRPPRACPLRRSPSRAPRARPCRSSSSPSSFWIARMRSRSRCSRLCESIDSLVRSSISRESLSTSTRLREVLEQLVEARAEIERLQQRLLLFGGRVHQPGDEIGELRGRLDVLERRDHLFRHLRQQAQDLDRALLQATARAPRFRCRPSPACGMRCDARDREIPAVEELEHAKALLALRDEVVRAVGPGHVAQHVRGRADPVQVFGPRIVDLGLASGAARRSGAAGARLPARRARDFCAADRDRQHDAGEQHEVAHRQDDERVVRAAAATARARPCCARRRARRACGARCGRRHRRTASIAAPLIDFSCSCASDAPCARLRIRQPFTSSRCTDFERHRGQLDAPLEIAVGNLETPDRARARRRTARRSSRARRCCSNRAALRRPRAATPGSATMIT